MAEKIEIETYKGQTIYYNEDSDKFECDISIEDKSKSTKRGSLKDVRKEIDTFAKLNLEFKPFKAIVGESYNAMTVREVQGIRTDGTFTVKREGYSSASYYGKKEMAELRKYNQDAIDAYAAAEAKRDAAQKEFRAEEKRILATLEPLDLSKYDALINQTA
jgi:hypothetical protein